MKDYQRETISIHGSGDVQQGHGALRPEGIIPHLRSELTHTRLSLTAQRRENKELKRTIRILAQRVRLLERLLPQ